MQSSPSLPSEAASRRRRELPDLYALKTFVAVCESGSMALAAVQMGVSQSAISQTVKALEAGYGVQLLDRDVRPARPTRAGNILLDAAGGLLTDARNVAQHLQRSTRQDHARIRLGCVDSFAATLGPPLIRALAGTAQQLQMWSGLTPGLNGQLLGRELDLAVCTEAPTGEPKLAQRLLFSECWVAVFPLGMSVPPFGAIGDLQKFTSNQPLIRYTQRSVIGQQIERFLRHTGIDVPRPFEFDATDPLLSLVAAGLGWALTTPLCLWQARAWLGEIQVVPVPPSRLGRRDFYLLSRDNEWAAMADELARMTRLVLQTETLPALHDHIQGLPSDALTVAEPPARKSPEIDHEN